MEGNSRSIRSASGAYGALLRSPGVRRQAGAGLVAQLTQGACAVGIILVAGIPLNPALTTLSLLVDQHATGRTVAEAFGWLSTGLAAGTGAASAIAGVVARRQHDARAAFIVAAVAGAAASLLALFARRVLGRRAQEGERS
jgi:hypothetical protein